MLMVYTIYYLFISNVVEMGACVRSNVTHCIIDTHTHARAHTLDSDRDNLRTMRFSRLDKTGKGVKID